MNVDDIRKRLESLAQPDVLHETLPTWGDAWFRRIDAGTRFELILLQEERQKKGQGLPSAVAIALTLCDANGELVYPDLETGLKAINALPLTTHDELAGPALRVSGLKMRALEDAEKKS
jgi:hypothetical protein